MAIDQTTFDTDLAGLTASITSLITEVEAAIASKPAADLTAEDQSVLTAAQNVQAELDKLNPTPPAPTPAPGA